MKAAGLADLTIDQLIALKIQDVTPEYVRELREQGLHPDADTLIAMRVQGVTPEYVRGLRAQASIPIRTSSSASKCRARMARITARMKEAGLQPDANQLIG